MSRPWGRLAAAAVAVAVLVAGGLLTQAPSGAVVGWPLVIGGALVVLWTIAQGDRTLRDHTIRQRAILESARDAIITVDGESRIVDLNRAAAELFGYAGGGLVGACIDVIFPPALLPAVQSGRALYRATGSSPALDTRLEFDARRADGSEFPAEFTFSRVTGVDPPLVTVCVRDNTERLRAADALRRSTDRFRTIIETSSDVVAVVAEDGTVRYVNEAVRSVLGYEPNELAGTSAYELVHPDDRRAIRALFDESMAQPGASSTGAFRLRHHDGTWRSVESITRNLLDDPDVRGLVSFARDVSARHRAEREVRLMETIDGALGAATDTTAASAMALHAVCEALGWAVGELWTPSPDGTAFARTLVWHEAGAAVASFAAAGQVARLSRHAGVTGRAWAERQAQCVSDVVAEFDRGGLAAAAGLRAALVVPVLVDEQPLALLALFAHTPPASDERPVELVAARLGELLQRRQTEDARRTSEALNRAVLSSLDAHIAVLDQSGVVLAVNDAWRRFATDNGDRSGGRLTGVGRNYLDICAAAAGDPSARDAMTGIRGVLRGSRPSFTLEYQTPTPAGEVRWFELVVNPLLGDRRGAVVSHIDVSARKRAEAALVAARESALEVARMKDEFIANLSHELRTPLTAIMGMNMLALETELTAEQREYLDVVQSASTALLELINDLLDFSRIAAGKLRVEHTDFELRRTIGETMRAHSVRAQPGVEIAWDVGADVPDALVGDPGRLRQVLGNLVGNAIKFTPQGEVVVRVTHEAAPCGVVLHVRVSDTGIGIPVETQRRIFEAFVQGDGSSTRRYGGTGIGLAITARLVELMGGTIRVESEVGRGSTFHFTVPAGLDERVRTAPVNADAKLASRRALVVAPNPTVSEILRAMLNGCSLRPVVVAGAAAVDTLRCGVRERDPFDVALIDADADGWTLADRIRADPALAGLALVMMVDSRQPAFAARARTLEHATHVVKPFGSEDIRSALRGVLADMPPAGDGSTPEVERSASRGVRVLLAEDEPVNRTVLLRLLERRGYDVTTVDDGAHVLELLLRERFDIVVMDVQMPTMDGLEATATIRARPASAGGAVPIVALTAHALAVDRERCMAAGMNAYLSKPVSPDELFATIDTLVPRTTHTEDTMPTVIDREEILERLSGDRELLAEVVDLFVADRATLLGDIRRALSNNDAKATREAAHRLKGVLATLAARGAVTTADTLEEQASKGDLSHGAAALDILEREVDVVQGELKKLVQELAP